MTCSLAPIPLRLSPDGKPIIEAHIDGFEPRAYTVEFNREILHIGDANANTCVILKRDVHLSADLVLGEATVHEYDTDFMLQYMGTGLGIMGIGLGSEFEGRIKNFVIAPDTDGFIMYPEIEDSGNICGEFLYSQIDRNPWRSDCDAISAQVSLIPNPITCRNVGVARHVVDSFRLRFSESTDMVPI